MPYGQIFSIQVLFRIFQTFSYFFFQGLSFKMCYSKLNYTQLRIQLVHLLIHLRMAAFYLSKEDLTPKI